MALEDCQACGMTPKRILSLKIWVKVGFKRGQAWDSNLLDMLSGPGALFGLRREKAFSMRFSEQIVAARSSSG